MQKILEPIRRTRFTKSTLRQASIREKKGPSLGKYKSKFLISEVPTLRNLRTDLRKSPRRRVETGQEYSKVHRKGHNYILLALGRMGTASTKEPEEREFVVDSGACMHRVSKKDLNSAELETVKISRNPTTVMTASGEVQTMEEPRCKSKNWTYSRR